MTGKEKLAMLEVQLQELQKITIQNSNILQRLSIIIEGSVELGVEGIREKQHRDEIFKEAVHEEIIKLRTEIDARFDNVDNNFDTMSKELKVIQDWKNTWDKVLSLMTNSKTWKVILILGIAITSLVMSTKYKILELLK